MRGDESPHFFGEWLKRRRQSMDLTQAELAERAGCSVFALRKIETGERRPSKQLAGLLGSALQLPSDQIDAFVAAARGETGCDRLHPPGRKQPAEPPAQHIASALHNWPPRLTPWVGRESELASLGRLLADPLCRLLTLIGPGGIGKTRLAVEVATQEQARFTDGVWFVPLAPVASGGAIVPAIADALELAFRGQVDPQVQLLSHLANKKALLVLDNVEHLLVSIGLFVDILAHAPGVKLLVTSRERLNLHSEYVFVTQGLPTPPIDHLHRAYEYDAIVLFEQSARRAGGDLSLQGEELAAAAQVCRLVEGMPLGIELAAAWTPLLRCREIAAEIQHGLDFLSTSLRDLPERQRSLRAVFDHSWRLLTLEERSALSRLAVFQGGFDRSAADEVAGANLVTLLALASKSLIRRRESGRYDLHEVVRQYALAHLMDDETTRSRHSRYYLALLDGREPDLRSSAQRQTLRSLLDEIDNLRAAWDWAVAQTVFDALAPAVRGFGCLFELSGWLEEGVKVMETAILAVGDGSEDRARGRLKGEMLAQQALLLMRQGRFMQALERAGESLNLLRPLADPNPLVRPLLVCSIILHMVGALDESQTAGEEALACAHVTGDHWGEAFADFIIGYVTHLRGDHRTGYERMRGGLSAWQGAGDPHSIAMGLNFLSPVAIQLGRYAEAEAFLQESLALCHEMGDRWGMGTALRFLGLTALAQGDAERARDRLCESLEVHRGFVTGWDIARSLIYLGQAVLALGKPAEAAGYFAEALIVAEEAQSSPLVEEVRMGLAEVEALMKESAL